MVRAWYLDSAIKDGNKSLPHITDPPQMVGMDVLKEKTGVLYWKIPGVDDYENDDTLNTIKKERGYTYGDEVNSRTMPDYDKTTKMWWDEHIHADEEIRFVYDGSGYFDVRDREDRWVRVEIVKGDMIILPAGIYHRFTLDTKDYIYLKRYFTEMPVWTPYPRSDPSTEEHPARKKYLQR